VKGVDAVFDIEREINGPPADERLAVRSVRSRGYTLIQTAKLNDVDSQARLAHVLAHINDHKIRDLDQLLPWNWKTISANHFPGIRTNCALQLLLYA
jgi:hypothetical protein